MTYALIIFFCVIWIERLIYPASIGYAYLLSAIVVIFHYANKYVNVNLKELNFRDNVFNLAFFSFAILVAVKFLLYFFESSFKFENLLEVIKLLAFGFFIAAFSHIDEEVITKVYKKITMLNLFILITLLGLAYGDHDSFFNPHDRLEAFRYGPGTIAAFALGTFFFALLSENRRIIWAALIFSFWIIVLTEMRGAGIALVGAILSYLYFIFVKRFGIISTSIVFLLLLALIVILFQGLIHDLLLLSDGNRGITSGFTGRFQRSLDGIEEFSNYLIFGSDMNNEVINRIYSLPIRIFAKYGGFGGVFLLLSFIVAISSSLRMSRYSNAAVIIGFFIFGLSSSRDFNLDILPFLGWLVIARELRLVKIFFLKS